MSQPAAGSAAPAPKVGPSVAGAAAAPAPTPQTIGASYLSEIGAGESNEHRAEALRVPGMLARLRLLAIGICLIFAALTTLQVMLGWQANRSAASDTEQLIRVQSVKANLLRADALATNAFLIGGLEPTEQRAAYSEALDSTVRDIADAADAQPADRLALSALNSAVLEYAASMEQARANNRQGLPVGSAYLREGSLGLRADALPILDALVAANLDRARTSMGSHHPLLILMQGIVALVGLYFINRWIAARFHRRYNFGVGVAAAGVAVVSFFCWQWASSQSEQNDELRAGHFTAVVDGATARTEANDAKSNESLRLIARGSGQVFEDAWVAAAETVTAALAGSDHAWLHADWDAYAAAHQDVVDLDEAGDWDGAVALATSTEEAGPSARFAAFDNSIARSLDLAGSRTTDEFHSGNTYGLVLAVLAFLIGLVAAGFASAGINRRRGEFA